MIRVFNSGKYDVNIYVIYDEKAKKCAIVDPGVDDRRVMEFIRSKHLTVSSIILTHGHGDHIIGLEAFKTETGAKVIAHRAAKEMLRDPKLNLTTMMTGTGMAIDADIYLEDGAEIEIGSMKWRIIHTPGHTKGSMCLYHDGWLIAGDTLFFESIGRFDLYGGDYKKLKHSILEKLLILDDEVIVYPGHGQASTIGHERKFNRMIR